MNRRLSQDEINKRPEHLRAFYAAIQGLAAQFPEMDRRRKVGQVRSALTRNFRTAITWVIKYRSENAVRAGIIEDTGRSDEEHVPPVSMREIRSIRQGQISQLTDIAQYSLKLVFGDIQHSAELDQPQE